jgi:hypothetical protein
MTIRPAWTPLTIFLMVIGFMIAWPLGLLMLAYILWGDRIPDFRRDGATVRHRARAWCYPGTAANGSGNVAFDEYRYRELKRLEEERRRLDEERRDFEAFVRNLRRAKDQEEFDRFMAERRQSKGGSADSTVL